MKFIPLNQFNTFLLTGGLAACVNFISRFLFEIWFSFSTSVILAYICGMITAYFLAKIYVFRDSIQTKFKSIFFFVCVNLFAVTQTWLISMGLVIKIFPYIGFNIFEKEVAHAIGIVIPVFTSYFGHKKWSFSK